GANSSTTAAGAKTSQPLLPLSDEERGDIRTAAAKTTAAYRAIKNIKDPKQRANLNSKPHRVSRIALDELEVVIGRIMEKRFGRDPAYDDVEKFYDNFINPFLQTLKSQDQKYASVFFELYRDEVLLDALHKLTEDDVIKHEPDDIRKPEVE